MRTAVALISCLILIFFLVNNAKETSQHANADVKATKEAPKRGSDDSTNTTTIIRTSHPSTKSENGRQKEQFSDHEATPHAVTTTSRHPRGKALNQPYQIFQLGDPRTASTFQFELLCSIVTWKMLQPKEGTSKEVPCQFIVRTQMRGARFQRRFRERVAKNETFVFKAHDDSGIVQELAKTTKNNLVVFSSGGAGSSYSIYTQEYKRLQRCPECEVDQYQDLFELSDTEVFQIKEHMKIYGVIRRCCGLQMSQYEMQRLHGCDMTKYKDRSAYPNCEQYSDDQMRAMEDTFAASPVPFRVTSPEYNWAKPGDCARFMDEILVEEKGFNGKAFLGCEDIP